MASTFVKWYYELLNSKIEEFRSDHFFPDASAKIHLQSQNNADSSEYFQVQNNGKQVGKKKNFSYEKLIVEIMCIVFEVPRSSKYLTVAFDFKVSKYFKVLQ